MKEKPLTKEWFARDAVELAPKLLGKIVRYGECAATIVETEAYTTDPASHAFRITPRSAILRDTYGVWYVYFTYGMHFCANVTTNKEGVGAVLIRAVEPIEGIEKMMERRGMPKETIREKKEPGNEKISRTILNLTNGPAKFCKAFGITSAENGAPLGDISPDGTYLGGVCIFDAPPIPPDKIGISGRIGISVAQELPWRFYIKGNPFVSRKPTAD
jgi:DNA-3-methyladenine glycosylase